MSVLWWPGKLLAEDDLRRHWTSQGEIVLGTKTIVTPLALDFLRGKRVALRREDATKEAVSDNGVSTWGLAVETPLPLLTAAVKALANEGLTLVPLEEDNRDRLAWMRAIAQRVARGNLPGAILVSEQAGLAACVMNKVNGVRAAMLTQPADVTPLKKSLGPNLFAMVATGRTYFELRQMVKLAASSPPVCPDSLEGA